MLTKRVIPCLDVDNGRVVKGISFVHLRDAGDPVELAKYYDEQGADELVFLDITASSDARDIMRNLVEEVSEQVFIPLTVGGGLRNISDLRMILESGADKVSINTAALVESELVTEASNYFGAQCIVVAIDAKKVDIQDNRRSFHTRGDLKGTEIDANSKWEVYSHGGRNPTGVDVVKWANKVVELGAGELLITSMDQDGHQNGYDTELLSEISETVAVPVIASGGAGSLDHLRQAIQFGKADAVLAASIFHYGTFTIKEVKEYLSHSGIPIRIVT